MKRINFEAPYFKALFYGRPGSTKTRTACSAVFEPRCGKVLYLDAGGNPLSIRDYERKPDALHLEKIGDLNPLYKWLLAGQPSDNNWALEQGLEPPYGTFIFDGMTYFQQLSFELVTGDVNRGPGDVQTKAEWPHYDSVLSQMNKFCRLFLEQLPMHVIITALEEEKGTADNPVYRPLMRGQARDHMPGYAYVVARLLHTARGSKLDPKYRRALADELKDSTSIAIFKQSEQWEAKDQYGRLGDYMIDPTIPQMFNLIWGEKGGE